MRPKMINCCSAALMAGLLFSQCGVDSHASSSKMLITKLTALPRVVRIDARITFVVSVQGIRLSFRDIGKSPAAGEGHLQFYLDRIPTDAWTRRDVRHTFLAAVGTPIAIFRFKYAAIKVSPGKHRVLVALAKNNNVLYHVPVASVTIWVKR
jgi:hypothetical protein